MENKVFISGDYNLNNYSKENLKLICDNKILVNCSYPKLIIELFNNINFKSWLKDNNINMNDKNKIIRCLINAIKLKSENSKNEVILEKISLYDDDLWLKIVDQFLFNDNINEYNSDILADIIIKRKKSLKKNISKTIEISI